MIAVLICGSELRGDDGAAVRAGRALPAAALARSQVREVGQLTPEELLSLGDQAFVVVDVVAGIEPGRVIRMPLSRVARLAHDRRSTHSASSHAIPLERAVALAEVVGQRPLNGIFVGIGGAAFEPDRPCSSAVEAAIPQLSAEIASAVTALARPRVTRGSVSAASA